MRSNGRRALVAASPSTPGTCVARRTGSLAPPGRLHALPRDPSPMSEHSVSPRRSTRPSPSAVRADPRRVAIVRLLPRRRRARPGISAPPPRAPAAARPASPPARRGRARVRGLPRAARRAKVRGAVRGLLRALAADAPGGRRDGARTRHRAPGARRRAAGDARGRRASTSHAVGRPTNGTP